MSRLVLDCSLAVAWCFADETTETSQTLLAQVRQDGGVVPALWHVEVGNVLLMAERRGRLTQAKATRMLAILAALPIATDEAVPARVARDVLPLARQHRLTVYDAMYLELALRLGLPLASKDTDLLAAARTAGVAAVPG